MGFRLLLVFILSFLLNILDFFNANANANANLLDSSQAHCEDLLGSCQFYVCKSTQYGCSQGQYLIQFGYNYCQKYHKKENQFSLDGINFLKQVRQCLQEQISQHARNCQDSRQVGFSSHVKCYEEAQFCRLSARDQERIKMIAWKEAFNPELKALREYILNCRSN